MMNLSNYAGIERPEMIENIRHINGEKIEVTYKDEITMLYENIHGTWREGTQLVEDFNEGQHEELSHNGNESFEELKEKFENEVVSESTRDFIEEHEEVVSMDSMPSTNNTYLKYNYYTVENEDGEEFSFYAK